MSFNMLVCIKSVVIEAPKGTALRTPENSELNPFDRPTLEAALQIREELGGTVTAIHVNVGDQVQHGAPLLTMEM